jgi:adenine-specific DNA-methyltransferase
VREFPSPSGRGVGGEGSFRVILDYVKGAQKSRAQLDEIANQAAAICKVQPEEIARHLRRYVARNQSDFFIHKRLQEALDDDLDIFLKTDVLNADQLLADDAGHIPARALRVARAIRRIGRRINAFLGVLEDYQKRLWEKKKLVLSTRYVITLDRLDKLAGRAFVEANLAAILADAAQVAEWRALGLGELTTAEAVRREDGRFLPLPVDTLHFGEDFKWALLAAVTKNYPLDESLDGVAIHSDNWQALNTMQEKYWERVQAVYADPPYNTDAGPISYKNGYRSSSWVSLMNDRLEVVRRLMNKDGVLCATIDDYQQKELRILIGNHFGDNNIVGTITIRANPSGRPTQTGFSIAHEYAIFARNQSIGIIQKLERSESQLERYRESDSNGIFEWRNFRREGSNSDRFQRKKLYYPIYICGENFRVPLLVWDSISESWKAKRLSKN